MDRGKDWGVGIGGGRDGGEGRRRLVGWRENGGQGIKGGGRRRREDEKGRKK